MTGGSYAAHTYFPYLGRVTEVLDTEEVNNMTIEVYELDERPGDCGINL